MRMITFRLDLSEEIVVVRVRKSAMITVKGRSLLRRMVMEDRQTGEGTVLMISKIKKKTKMIDKKQSGQHGCRFDLIRINNSRVDTFSSKGSLSIRSISFSCMHHCLINHRRRWQRSMMESYWRLSSIKRILEIWSLPHTLPWFSTTDLYLRKVKITYNEYFAHITIYFCN